MKEQYFLDNRRLLDIDAAVEQAFNSRHKAFNSQHKAKLTGLTLVSEASDMMTGAPSMMHGASVTVLVKVKHRLPKELRGLPFSYKSIGKFFRLF